GVAVADFPSVTLVNDFPVDALPYYWNETMCADICYPQSDTTTFPLGPARLLFFGVLGEIVPPRDLAQHPGTTLIAQALKGSMNMSFQISELGGLVSQLGDPLTLLFLQLLLYLPQHLANVFHYGPALPLHTHFHTPPAIRGVQLVCHLHKPQFIPNRF